MFHYGGLADRLVPSGKAERVSKPNEGVLEEDVDSASVRNNSQRALSASQPVDAPFKAGLGCKLLIINQSHGEP